MLQLSFGVGYYSRRAPVTIRRMLANIAHPSLNCLLKEGQPASIARSDAPCPAANQLCVRIGLVGERLDDPLVTGNTVNREKLANTVEIGWLAVDRDGSELNRLIPRFEPVPCIAVPHDLVGAV